jgi:glutamine phosphoribosylpyrophosphate amidotransferase
MCAVIGVCLDKPMSNDLDFYKNIILQSKIRGLHATGLSYVKNNCVHTLIEPVSADYFIEKYYDFDKFLNEDGNLYSIAHCRYSTSDLEHNQPIQTNTSFSVVHNGVITQTDPNEWFSTYGLKTITNNDTELINAVIEKKKDPIEFWNSSSMAVIELHSNKKIKFYRNGKRPLYKTDLHNGYLLTSTADIVKRTNNMLKPVLTKKLGEQHELQS